MDANGREWTRMDAKIRRTDPTANKRGLSQIEMPGPVELLTAAGFGGQVYKRYLEENSGLG
jgi:hypothetical protein